jgi:hypothetical protein
MKKETIKFVRTLIFVVGMWVLAHIAIGLTASELSDTQAYGMFIATLHITFFWLFFKLTKIIVKDFLYSMECYIVNKRKGTNSEL